MTKKHTIIALVLAVAVFFAMTLSVFIITHEVNHECIGNGCQVCQLIEFFRQGLKTLASGNLAIAIALALTYASCKIICCFARTMLQGSLVALKVELLN